MNMIHLILLTNVILQDDELKSIAKILDPLPCITINYILLKASIESQSLPNEHRFHFQRQSGLCVQ